MRWPKPISFFSPPFTRLMYAGTLRNRTDFQQHAQHFFVGAAVQRAVQRRGRRGRGRVRIHVRAAHAAHGVGRAVLLVVGVQDEQDVQRALQHRIGPVLQLRRLEQHVQEIPGIAQVVVRIGVRHAQAVAIGEGRQRRHLADQPPGLLLARTLVENVLGVRIERRERPDRAKSSCPWGGRRSGSRPGIS